MLRFPLPLAALSALLVLNGCVHLAAPAVAVNAEIREHDKRNSFVPVNESTFAAMPNAMTTTDRWAGVLDGAAYRVEVPTANWNGKLVLYAHGYAGTGNALTVQDPPIRRYLVDSGYAWAASSYSKNYYDVRAGVEDTNALALAFNSIAASRGRALAAPSKTYIVGRSMGGHIAAAAVEAETLATAKNKVRYDGAAPACGVLGDTELWNYFGGYQLAAQQLAGVPVSQFPTNDWTKLAPYIRTTLFDNATSFATPNAQGAKLKAIVKNLTGGARPIFDEGFANVGLQNVVWGAMGGDGTVNGMLNANVVDTRAIRYAFDAPEAVIAAFNNAIYKIAPAPEANGLRRDGLRWVPKVNGEFAVPVLTIHTLGDMYVPFKMEQIYRERAIAKGNDSRLVQRAIRAPGHCDFTVAEQVDAFSDLVKWVELGVRPAGDDVLTASVVAHPDYGCAFTKDALVADDTAAARQVRAPGKLPMCASK